MYGTSQSGDAFPPERDSALPNYNLTHFSTLSEIRKKTKKKIKKYGKILAEKDPGILDFKALYTILTRESQTIAR